MIAAMAFLPLLVAPAGPNSALTIAMHQVLHCALLPASSRDHRLQHVQMRAMTAGLSSRRLVRRRLGRASDHPPFPEFSFGGPTGCADCEAMPSAIVS